MVQPLTNLVVPCRWQAASKLANRLGLFSRGSVRTQAQRKRRTSVIANSIRKVSSHLHRHRHSESLMASYLRMQAAAAAEPVYPGREGQVARQVERQHEGHGDRHAGQSDRHKGQGDRHEGQGEQHGEQHERESNGQLTREAVKQGGSPDMGTCCADGTTACSAVGGGGSLQASGCSCRSGKDGLSGVGSVLIHEDRSQAASMEHSTECLICDLRTVLVSLSKKHMHSFLLPACV